MFNLEQKWINRSFYFVSITKFYIRNEILTLLIVLIFK